MNLTPAVKVLLVLLPLHVKMKAKVLTGISKLNIMN
jgi:hypothetical protein